MRTPTARKVLIGSFIAVVIGLVLANRLSGADTSTVTTVAPPPVTAAASSSSAAPAPAPSAVDDHGDGDDGVSSDPPATITPTDRPDVREAATSFTAAWLNTYNRTAEAWRATLTDRVTDDLAADLAYADPQTVPAGAKVGTPVQVTVEGSLFNAKAPVVEATPQAKPIGALHLTLVRAGATTWLISEIDWRAAR